MPRARVSTPDAPAWWPRCGRASLATCVPVDERRRGRPARSEDCHDPAVPQTTRAELAYLVVTIVVALVVAVSVSLLAGAVVLALLSVAGRVVIRWRI